jgi:hypothetical protein
MQKTTSLFNVIDAKRRIEDATCLRKMLLVANKGNNKISEL